MGGAFNAITGNIKYSNILGGQSNLIKNDNEFLELNYSNILGGYLNIISGEYSTIFGGRNNIITGNHSNILGSGNRIRGDYSNIFGHYNTSTGSFNTIIGSYVDLTGRGLFYIGDSITGNQFGGRNIKTFAGEDTLIVNVSGGVKILGGTVHISGYNSQIPSPLIIQPNNIRSFPNTGTIGSFPGIPLGGIYLSGNFLCIRTV
jgi:hypothetical protein